MSPIDWSLLGQAVAFYARAGWTYRETPWVIMPEVSQITYEGSAISCQFGDLVGSAEQGFLALDIEPGAKLVSCGPCFRNETVVDDLHQPWFMKVELYREGHHLNQVISYAEAFMRRILGHRADLLVREITPQGLDLCLGGIEVGSYGERAYRGRKWTYGTGLALPRFSQAVQALG